MSATTIVPKQSLKRVVQRASIAHLYRDLSNAQAPSVRSRKGHLDAIIVPASRPPSFLRAVIQMAASLDILLVVLASRQTDLERVAQRVARTRRGRCLIIPIAEKRVCAGIPARTSDRAFDRVKAGRTSDLSLKRNLGLLLARLHGWNKIAFIDDDIKIGRPEHFARLAGQLEFYQAAGMVVDEYPDNSVVSCPPPRGQPQDVFVSGAVLGVHTSSLPLSFFPDIYNEDWFFFAREAAAKSCPEWAGLFRRSTTRSPAPTGLEAKNSVNLLAEGLFALFGQVSPTSPLSEQLAGATIPYWTRFIDARHAVLTDTRSKLLWFAQRDAGNKRVRSALRSLAAAESVLTNLITPRHCADFVTAWQDDLRDWERFTSRVNNVGGTREAMDSLGLEAGVGRVRVPRVIDPRGTRRVTAQMMI